MKTSETIDAQNLQIRNNNNQDLELSGFEEQLNLNAIESHLSQMDNEQVKVVMPLIDNIRDEKSVKMNKLQIQGSIDSMTDIFQYENSNTLGEFNQSQDTMTMQSQLNSDMRSNSPVKVQKNGSKLDFGIIDQKYQTQKPQFTAQQRTQNMISQLQQQKIDEIQQQQMKNIEAQSKNGQSRNNSYDSGEEACNRAQNAMVGNFTNITNIEMFPQRTSEENYQNIISQMQPMKHNQLIEQLRNNVGQNIGQSMMEGEGYQRKHVCAANDFKARNNQTNYNFNCECTVCINQVKKMKHKEEFDLNTKGIKEQKQFDDFMVREVDNDGLALKTQRKWVIEKSNKTGRSMVKRRFQNENPEWQDINRPTYAYTDMIGPDSPKFDYLKDMQSNQLSFLKKKVNYVFMQRSYNWLMMHLLSNSDKIAGCEVNIPEQCIFMDCKPKYYLKNDKDGSILSFNQTKRLNTDVHAHFMALGIERKKLYGDDGFPTKTPKGQQGFSNSLTDTSFNDLFGGLNNSNSIQESVTFGSQLDLDSPEKRQKALGRLLGVDQDHQCSGLMKRNSKKIAPKEREIPSHLTKHYYKDQYIIRQFQDEGNKDYMGVKTILLPEAEFVKRDGRMRGHDEFWNSVSCLMMTPQSKIGLGKAFKFTFTPILIEGERDISDKINMEQPKFKDQYIIPQKQSYNNKVKNKYQGQIQYDFNQFGNDDLSLQTKNPHAYCLKSCHKIGFFLQQVHQIEILRMDVEFYQDETGLVLFYSANDIWIRCSEAKSRLLKNNTISKRDTSENSRYIDPNEVMLKAPQSFWDNLHKGASSLGTKQRRQNNVQNYICNELSSLIWQSNKDDIQNKEDVIELLTRVNQNMKNDTEEKFSSRMGQQMQLVDKQQKQTRNKQSTTASPTGQMLPQKTMMMKAKLEKRMSGAHEKSKLTTLTSFGEQNDTSYNSRNHNVSIKNNKISENQKSNKEIFSQQRPKQKSRNFFDSRNKQTYDTTMTKIGLLGEVNRRQVQNSSTDCNLAACRTMIRMRDQSPNSEKMKLIQQKNQNLLQWLRNNKDSKKKKPENEFLSMPYQQTATVTSFGAVRANSSKQISFTAGQRDLRKQQKASLSQPNHNFINTEYNSAEYKKEPETSQQPNDTYQSSTYNQGPMNLIDDKIDNYSYSLESITYEQPIKKSLLHYIKNPNKHVYRYDKICHPNQPPVKNTKIPILTYSSNRPLNLQEKVIQKISKNKTTHTLNNYQSVPKLQQIPKNIMKFGSRQQSVNHTVDKDLPSVFTTQKENNISNMTFGSHFKMNDNSKLDQALQQFQKSKMEQAKSQDKIRSFSKQNEAYQKRIYTDRMKAEQKYDKNLRTGFLDNDFKNDYFKDLNVHLSDENRIHNQLLPDKHQRETTISFMEAQISSNIINIDSIMNPLTSRLEQSKMQSNITEKNKKIMTQTSNMKALTDMDKSQSTFYTKAKGDLSQTLFMDTNRPNLKETIEYNSVEGQRTKGFDKKSRNSDIISLNIKFGRSGERVRERPLDKHNSKSLFSNVLNIQP